MNHDEAKVAADNKAPVVDTYTGEVGVIDSIKKQGGEVAGAHVLYLGSRLARLTQLGDLALVDSLAADAAGVVYVLHEAGKVHGEQKGAEGK